MDKENREHEGGTRRLWINSIQFNFLKYNTIQYYSRLPLPFIMVCILSRLVSSRMILSVGTPCDFHSLALVLVQGIMEIEVRHLSNLDEVP